MIHSLAGGKLKDLDYADFVKVKFEYSGEGKIGWFVTDIIDINIGDTVIIPYGFPEVEIRGIVQKNRAQPI